MKVDPRRNGIAEATPFPENIPMLFYQCRLCDGTFLHILTHKFGSISLDEDTQYNQRQDITHINPCPGREMDSLPFIGLRHELLKSPTIPAGAE